MARKDRRRFLTGMLATGAATAVAPAIGADEAEEKAKPSALPPTTQVAALETQTPGEMAESRLGGVPGPVRVRSSFCSARMFRSCSGRVPQCRTWFRHMGEFRINANRRKSWHAKTAAGS